LDFGRFAGDALELELELEAAAPAGGRSAVGIRRAMT
jgi:hypothetical protein